LVLWNTRYLQQALKQWQETEGVLNPDEVVRLSPLLHEHVNTLNRYDLRGLVKTDSELRYAG
jgi:hypothetical protein